MNLNEYQLAAVTEPPKDITVSAAAGSGKTQVLGERVLRRISGENPVDVSRLLIVTFTRSAAAEMRSRISRSISAALKEEASPVRRRNLERQLSLLGGADICTIDSFCYRILKQNFFRVPGLSGDFTVGDEGGVRLICSDALRDTVEMFSAALEKSKGGELIAAYRAKADKFFALYPDAERAERVLAGFDALAGNYSAAKRTSDFLSDDGAYDYTGFVRELQKELSAVPDPDAWLDLCERDFDGDCSFDEARPGRFAATAAARLFEDIVLKIENELEHGGLNAHNTATFEATLEGLKAIPVPKDYAEAHEIFSSPFPRGGTVVSKDTKKEKGNPHAAAVMNGAKSIWESAAKLFSSSPDEIELFRRRIAPVITGLCEVTRRVCERETELMLEKKKLSFSACVSLTLKLLVNDDGSPSETALELREAYDEIYVDEAQDIDPRQMALFSAISKGRLFMVGDVKQSIYGFRRAAPEIFNSRPSDGVKSRVITMNLNYRSDEKIISAVNEVFGRLMNESTMDVDYENGHKMLCGSEPKTKPVRCEFIAVTGDGGRKYCFDIEATAVAKRINELLSEKALVYDKNLDQTRPVEYRDIIVLMRSTKSDGGLLERVLTENGIPCYFDGGEGLFSRGEISVVINALNVLNNPFRDIPLVSVLRSLMFGFSENDLLKIRAVSSAHSFSRVFYALCTPKHPRHDEYVRRLCDDELLKRCVNVGESLERWREAAGFRPVSEVIELIVNETDFYSSVGALPAGAKRRANLELLTDTAEKFEEGGRRGLFGFIEYIKKQNLIGTDSSLEAKTLSDSMNVVRIMTIHKSKGLEAPVVILAKTSSISRHKTEAFALGGEIGFCLDYINEESGYKYKSPLNRLIGYSRRGREQTEEIRLLYVAMTRARERFIAMGYFMSRADLDKTLAFDGDCRRSDAVLLIDSMAKMLGASLTNESLWRLNVIESSALKVPALSDRLKNTAAFSEKAVENAARLFGFEQSVPALHIPAKLSVSKLKESDIEGEPPAVSAFPSDAAEPLRVPAFLKDDEKISGARVGTLYHTVMENLDFSRAATEQIDAMESAGIISAEERKLIKDERIDALLRSPLGQRMKAAKCLRREAPFMINIPAASVEGFEDARQDETIAVQGIIDCFFEEDDAVVIVDYKTDTYAEPSEVAERYKKQLYYYGKAINMKFSDKKIQKYLYLFFKGDIIEV